MLDSVTKARINAARDILVGKVPDPKSQVEHITIALIYKFMDDMDAETEALGGKRTFFTGKYEKYGWRKIFDPKLSGFDMLNLYSEAITQLNIIPSIPQLFRDIFKNAYLPYRDPETLKAFLKIINEFEYDHSERLGDAFEFLLSVLGSQGDAGQFRTPRHIIDFVVRITDPKKQDKILDPACGTAGFLISGYKHILKQNSKDGIAGRALTNDDRKRLVQNFRGYDISPDMVRLSLVNMYLHGFTTPHIEEYDTLTSEDKWNEYFDVVLANPPFMSPKGGIRPHKRFSVQSNRSEVLFVDYIAEHLTPNGRAAIIVPEGIIFQSGTAYKQLRKMLVEQYLYAVVSLPAGVFNPYSGVKTSILLLDKTIAKRSNKILFVKIQNDGFDLGAQRRAIDKSDLYFAEELVKYYKQHVSLDDFDATAAIGAATKQNKADHEANEEIPLVKVEQCQWLHIDKTKIAENGDWNLSGDRYRVNQKQNSQFEIVEIGAICETTSGGTPLKTKPEYYERGTIPWLKSGEVAQGYVYHSEEFITESGLKNSSAKILPVNTVLVAMYGATAGQVGVLKFPATTNQAVCGILPNEKVKPDYLYWVLKSCKDDLIQLSTGGAQPNISQKIIREFKIPLPPLSIQEQIVAEIESYQKVIDGARQVVENYKPNIYIQPEWDVVELGEVCEVNPKKSEVKDLSPDAIVSFVPMADVNENEISFEVKDSKKIEEVYNGYTYFKDYDVLLAKVTPCFENGKSAIAKNLSNSIGFGSSEFFVLRSKGNILPEWIYYNISNDIFKKIGQEKMTGTGGLQRLPREFVESYKIPLPPLAEQEAIVAQLETERQLVANNKQLIALMQQKIQATIARVWGGGKQEGKVYEENEFVSIAAEP